MLRFEPPRHDPARFTNADLGAVGGLVQSLRWFNSRASILLYCWGMHETNETEALKKASTRPLLEDTMFMLRRSILYSVILEVRALHDRDGKSLGSRQAFERLGDPIAREGLHSYLRDHPQGRVMQDVAMRDRYLDYVQRYCGLMSAPVAASTTSDHPLSAKVELVRRMANKSVAHSTLDDYILGGEDLSDVVIATTVIACAIEAAIGDAAISNDLAIVESAGYRAAGQLLHVDVDHSPYNVSMIRAFLPDWIKSGCEFPNYPNDFRRPPSPWVSISVQPSVQQKKPPV
jgi:hypothetical protein